MSETDTPEVQPAETSPGVDPARRSTLVQLITAFVSFLLVAVPSALSGLFFLDPLLRKKGSGKNASGGDLDGFIKLDVTSDVIPDNGTPVSVTVVLDHVDDAWNRFRDVPVGSIWLRRNSAGEIVSFSSVCPHLGCSVNYRRSDNDFFCPCHTSSFDLDGTKTNQVPPRDMDQLQVVSATDGQRDPAGRELWVKYQNFKGARSEKIPI